MIRRLTAVFLCLMLLPSCSVLPEGGGDDLLQAPMLNRQQAEVSSALQAALDLSEIVYRYPQRGDHRSPFVFYDLDGDGLDEAVVFYAPDSGSSETRAMVLRQRESGSWYPYANIAGSGDQVDFITFAPMFPGRGDSLIIGWKDTNLQDRTYLGIYSVEGEDFAVEFLESYLVYNLYDSDGDGLDELLLVQQSGGRFHLRLLRELRGQLVQQDQATLYYEMTGAIQMLRGRVWDGSDSFQAVYIDQEIASSFYATEVYRVEDGALTQLAGRPESRDNDSGDSDDEAEEEPEDNTAWQNYMATFREQRVLSVDLGGNGSIEVPRTEDLPGAGRPGDSDEDRSQLTVYMSLLEDGFVPLFNAVVNADAGYALYFPDRWLGSVTLVEQPERSEWRFYRIDGETGSLGGELLRVRVYSTQEDSEWAQDEILLATKGVFRYYATIPASTAGDFLAVTQAEVFTMFMLL